MRDAMPRVTRYAFSVTLRWRDSLRFCAKCHDDMLLPRCACHAMRRLRVISMRAATLYTPLPHIYLLHCRAIARHTRLRAIDFTIIAATLRLFACHAATPLLLRRHAIFRHIRRYHAAIRDTLLRRCLRRFPTRCYLFFKMMMLYAATPPPMMLICFSCHACAAAAAPTSLPMRLCHVMRQMPRHACLFFVLLEFCQR